MRLRLRLLLLIALLLAGVLASSFAWIFRDLRARYSSDLQASLDSAVTAFGAGEAQRFRTLEVMAGSLEASPSFRNVLRLTDQATLIDFAQSTAQGLQVDLLIISDAQGKLKVQTAGEGTVEHPAAARLRGWAGATKALRHYWWMDGSLYQGATVALVDSQDYIDGYVSVGYRMDQAMLERLSKELDSQLELRGGGSILSSQLGGVKGRFLSRQIPLGPADMPLARLLLARSLAPIETVVATARGKLLGLASVAFLLALAASYPLVGRIANPLEALQKAQAEMAAIFSASLDGLIAFDEVGRVTMANPAAAVALGRQSSDLVDKPLLELLPDSVLRELTIAPAGVEQQADFERAERLYKLHRTFVRAEASMNLGSILLFHDVTDERQRERRVSRFVQHLCQRLQVPESPWGVRVGLATLAAWSNPSEESGQCPVARISHWVDEMSASLPSDRACRVSSDFPASESVSMSPKDLRLLIDILLDNAVFHGAGEIVLTVAREGGSLRLTVEDEGAESTPDLDAGLRAPGLGLKVAKALCSAAQGRLEVGPRAQGGTRATALLPRSVG